MKETFNNRLVIKKRTFMKSLLIVSFAFLVGGCANPINRYTAARYYEMGTEAEYQGNLEAARESYRRAFLNSDWGLLGAGAKASTLYEYGRVSGYLCFHDEAEKALKESLVYQDKDASARAQLRAPTLLELARFYYDTNRKVKALPYYEEGIELVRKLGGRRRCLKALGNSIDRNKIELFCNEFAQMKLQTTPPFSRWRLSGFVG